MKRKWILFTLLRDFGSLEKTRKKENRKIRKLLRWEKGERRRKERQDTEEAGRERQRSEKRSCRKMRMSESRERYGKSEVIGIRRGRRVFLCWGHDKQAKREAEGEFVTPECHGQGKTGGATRYSSQ